jgi:hypothetical protein
MWNNDKKKQTKNGVEWSYLGCDGGILTRAPF